MPLAMRYRSQQMPHLFSFSFPPQTWPFQTSRSAKVARFLVCFFFFPRHPSPRQSQSPESAGGFHVFQCSITQRCLLGLKPCLWMCIYHAVHECSRKYCCFDKPTILLCLKLTGEYIYHHHASVGFTKVWNSIVKMIFHQSNHTDLTFHYT